MTLPWNGSGTDMELSTPDSRTRATYAGHRVSVRMSSTRSTTPPRPESMHGP